MRCLKNCSSIGQNAGQLEFIPRISLTTTPTELPFVFKRRQFPIKLAFAMTINKSQGQSVKHVGIDLRIPVFSHGQLYVALSRTTAPAQIRILLSQDNTLFKSANVVYPEVLLPVNL